MLENLTTFWYKVSRMPYWQIALLAVLSLAGLVGGCFVLRTPPRPAPDFHSSEEVASEEPQQLTVHVAGAVNYPGVVRLQEGERVIDAIEEAGGPLPEADLDGLNLAQPIQDGQRIIVPRQGEAPAESKGGGDTRGPKVNINLAGQRELEELPGIGPTLAQRIIAYREKKGGFKNIEELKQVGGIGEKKFEELRDYIEI